MQPALSPLAIAAIFALAAASLPAAEVVQLPEWRAPESTQGVRFARGGPEKAVAIWGRGADNVEPFYFDEWLPALFERTVVFDTLELPQGGLRWVFTGDLGGFTVWVEKDRIALYQRFYDSYGQYDFDAEGQLQARQRMPEKRIIEESRAYAGNLASLTVILRHDLTLIVLVNDQEIFRQHCLLDVQKHQLQLSTRRCRIAGTLLTRQPEHATVTLDAGAKHQTMMGFGGIVTPMAYAQLSPEGRQRWWEYVSEYNLLIQREYPIGSRLDEDMSNWDVLSDALPHYYGDNFPNSEISDFDYIRTIRKLGGKVWFEFWRLPDWANQQWKDSEGRTRTVADPNKYAAAMLDYVKASKKKAGTPPDVVGIQNEVIQPAEIWKEMTTKLRASLDEAGFADVKIHMADASNLQQGIRSARTFTSMPEVWEKIDYSAAHMYDFQEFFTHPDDYDAILTEWKEVVGDKPMLSTELCINNTNYQIQSYRIAALMGQLYHKNLVMTDAVAIAYCWTLLNVEQPSYGWTRTLFVPDERHGMVPAPGSNQLRVFGAFSRRIKEGMTRIDCESSAPDLFASAFVDAKGRQTVVLLNRGTRALDVEVGKSFRWMELVDPYHENMVSEMKAGTVRADPGAVVTLSDVPLNEIPKDFKPVK